MKRYSCYVFTTALGCALLLPVFGAGAAIETVIYSFCARPNCADGVNIVAPLLAFNGKLYGTAYSGGDNTVSGGTVFSLRPAKGRFKKLYSFGGDPGGQNPAASLIEVNGLLYGTTYQGGSYACCGSVFSINPSTGDEIVVYSFAGNPDGSNPSAGLLKVGGTLFGTTIGGGSYNLGAVFSLDPIKGTEAIVHSFGSQNEDGGYPYAGLIDVNGKLYGTTSVGGRSAHGTVFSIDLKTGSEKVAYSFCSKNGCADGDSPETRVLNVNGILYGTTYQGGTYNAGVVFSLNPNTGTEKVLHSFGGTYGANPSDVVDLKGKLYGTTSGGGTYGFGVVFKIDPNTGAETVLHAFSPTGNDGANPLAGLIYLNDKLYGTTSYGGAFGGGTVFSIRR
jgi:uncharacterized repeat protein (TIGR03803 family)